MSLLKKREQAVLLNANISQLFFSQLVVSENEELLNQLAAIPNPAPASKFNLKFKKALTSKGRPRKRSKQLASFNKTRHDRKENKEKKTKSKKSATSTKTTTQRTRKVANILNAGTEEDENFSASELLDGIQGEPLNLPQPSHDILYNPAQQLQPLQPFTNRDIEVWM